MGGLMREYWIAIRHSEDLAAPDGDPLRVGRRLLETVRAHADGTVPPGVDQPEAYRRRGVQLTLAPDANWYQLTEEMVHQVEAPAG
jgi:hypothetical protein